MVSLAEKQASEKQREQGEIARIDAFLDGLYQNFFANFANQYPQLKSDTTSNIHVILQKLLATSILTSLSAESKAVNQAIRARFYARPKHAAQDFDIFLNHLDAAFLHRPPLRMKLFKLFQEDMYTIYAIALALHETVFAIPRSIYSGIERISREIQESLIHILEDIDNVREAYGLSILQLVGARTRLYREIAQFDGFVWFPMRSLSTAPLAADELARFCVGRSAAVDRFARHIVKNNGVTLIAGYRGVGKSTFVNAVEARLPDLEKLQEFQDKRHIVTVKVNLAKVSSVINVLRLCTRNLYHKFLVEEPQHAHTDLEQLLDADERRLLRWAYVCATRKVDMQWSESVETIKNLEASLDLKPGDLLPKSFGGGILGALLPSFGAKTSREWNKRMEHSIALLDYDEDRAEEDIVAIIERLSKANERRNYGFKIVFIFDEMDKVDDDVVIDLIKKLKNLFLSRHVVFILVTGKEFYYNWLKAQGQEDSMLSSYFSAVRMIPLFTSTETAELLKRLHLEDKKLSPQEEAFARTIALHLTYQAKGLPREIVRIVEEIQEEVPGSLQSYLTDGSNQRDVFQVYADLQEVLEGIVKDIPESDWKEQAERGLYNLMEYFFSQKTVLIGAASLKDFQTANFSLVPSQDFKMLIERLLLRLPPILVKDVTHPDGHVPLFSMTTQENDTVLVVSDAFYQLTGRVAAFSSNEFAQKNLQLPIEEIRDRLRQDNLLRWKEAFEALKQYENKPLSEEVYARLYQIFISPQATQNFNPNQAILFRHSAAQYLKGNKTFFVYSGQRAPGEFINNETNEQLIRDFIQLVQLATTDQEQQQGTQMLLTLLKVNKQSSLKRGTRRPLPKDIQTDLVSTICLLAKADILEEVLSNLDPGQDIIEILQPLQRLSSFSRRRFIDLLISLDFRNIEQSTLQQLLKGLLKNEETQKEIWHLALNQKKKTLAQRIMQIILQQWVASNLAKEVVFEWIDSKYWEPSIEDLILRDLVKSNRNYFLIGLPPAGMTPVSEAAGSGMLPMVGNVRVSPGRVTLALALKETEPPPSLEPEQPSGKLLNPINLLPGAQAKRAASGVGSGAAYSAPASPASSSNVPQAKMPSKSRNNRIKVIVIVLCVAVFFAIPLDLPLSLTLWSYLATRFLEGVYISAFFIGVVMLWYGLSEKDGGGSVMGLVSLAIGAGCLVLQLFFFRLSYSVLGQIALITPMLVLWGLIVSYF